MWFEWIKFESALFLGLFCETHFVFEGCYLRTIHKEDCKTAALHHLCWWTEKDSRHTAHTDWEQKNKEQATFSFFLQAEFHKAGHVHFDAVSCTELCYNGAAVTVYAKWMTDLFKLSLCKWLLQDFVSVISMFTLYRFHKLGRIFEWVLASL